MVFLVTTFAAFCVTRAGATESPKEIVGKDGGRMVLVPAAPFVMGSGEGREDEAPPHVVDLPAFYIDVTEVTTDQYARFVRETGHVPPPDWRDQTPPPGRNGLPMTNITWYDAMRYAIWAGKRLPTEAEWEKAARGTDGRRYPWGETDAKEWRNIDGDTLKPVGTHVPGASPYGCLDMAGNAWEWTADWYQPYPGTTARTLAFGRKYKVMRGSGAAYFYALNENSGRCSLRGRLSPYAGEDYLGFRCAADADASRPAYDPRKLLEEAEAQLEGTLREPANLSYESEYGRYRETARFPIRIVGENGQSGPVRTGIPFPSGAVPDASAIGVFDADGRPRATQTRVLGVWPDGSARWVLLDFNGTAGETCEVRFRGENRTAEEPRALTSDDQQIRVHTGPMAVVTTKDSFVQEIRLADGTPVVGPMSVRLTLAKAEGGLDEAELTAQPADPIEVEERGPLRYTLRLQGPFVDAAGRASPFRYDMRLHLNQGASRVHILLTVTHLQPRTGKEDARTPMAKVKDFRVRFGLPAAVADAVFGGDRSAHPVRAGSGASLLQPDHLQYALRAEGQPAATGTRAAGWAAVPSGPGWAIFGVRHFWQNAPKAIEVTGREVCLRLWAGKDPFEWEATLAKTHEIVIDVASSAPDRITLDPLRASMPPAWACGTEALGGPALPRSAESIGQFPYWELLREWGMQKWVRDMRYGFRDFGDVRHGGETKGKNAANNLEYDVPFNFLLQFLRTGHVWYLMSGEIQARHQADIDTDHVTGHPYKHSPDHTTWRADLAHQFLRGLVLHYWLTGEQRSLEIARKIGDHIAKDVQNPGSVGNERQIGWSLYALTGIYEATREERYLQAAKALCDRLIGGQSPTGKFAIRWDNRMSLMNGMAMNGMMSVQELTGDAKLADSILRLCRRTLGFYPEYACRTLHGYGWALRRTNDPRYLDVLERTWESCLEFLKEGAATVEVHAWQFTWFAAKYGLVPMFDGDPPALPAADTWKGLRLEGGEAELFILPREDSASVLAVLHGMTKGTAELYDAGGRRLAAVELGDDGRLYQPAAFQLSGRGVHRLRLRACGAIDWQVHHDARARVVLYDPTGRQLRDLYPAAYGAILPGAKEIVVRMEAIGEGFHGATLFDPDGHVSATVEHFVDLDDKGRYEIELKVPVGDSRRTGWSLQIHQSKVLGVAGLSPYWSSLPEGWFDPERATK